MDGVLAGKATSWVDGPLYVMTMGAVFLAAMTSGPLTVKSGESYRCDVISEKSDFPVLNY